MICESNLNMSADSICIYYFPETQYITTNIWLKYYEIENIAKQMQYFKNDKDINTILCGGIWYKIYFSKSYLQQGNVLERIKMLIMDFNNGILYKKDNNIIMCIRYKEHIVDVLYHNYPNFNTETLEKMASDEFVLVEIIKKNISI